MAIAFDASSTLNVTGGASTFNHTPVGTPKGILLLMSQGDSDSEHITANSVTYGGVSMTPLTGQPWADSSAETGVIYGWFLGSSIPTGTQAVAWTQTTTSDKSFVCISYTASGDTEISVIDAGINNTSGVTAPSDTIALSSISSAVAMALRSGMSNFTGLSLLTGWTSQGGMDFGVSVGVVATYDTVGTSDVTYGWNQTSETAQGVAVAIKEAAGGGATTLDAAAGS